MSMPPQDNDTVPQGYNNEDYSVPKSRRRRPLQMYQPRRRSKSPAQDHPQSPRHVYHSDNDNAAEHSLYDVPKIDDELIIKPHTRHRSSTQRQSPPPLGRLRGRHHRDAVINLAEAEEEIYPMRSRGYASSPPPPIASASPPPPPPVPVPVEIGRTDNPIAVKDTSPTGTPSEKATSSLSPFIRAGSERHWRSNLGLYSQNEVTNKNLGLPASGYRESRRSSFSTHVSPRSPFLGVFESRKAGAGSQRPSHLPPDLIVRKATLERHTQSSQKRSTPTPPPSRIPTFLPPPLSSQKNRTARDRRSAPLPENAYSSSSRGEDCVAGNQDVAPPLSPSAKRYSEVPSQEISDLTLGSLPGTPDVLRPDDSRSEVGQTGSEKLRPASGIASVAGSSSASQRPSSSGTLGAKGYHYTPLREREIRLVKILKATMSTIKCEIHRAWLDDPLDYTAISYTWGDAEDTRQIVLVEETMSTAEDRLSIYDQESIQYSIPVAASLHGALGALRRRDRDVYVWVDALCIDQQNRDERAQQVKLMTSIYRLANRVAIWLGPEEDQSNLAMALLEEFADHQHSPEYIKELIAKPSMRQDFAAVVSLFERDYWNRLWVVQEVYNARNIVVYCGDRTLPWSICKLASKSFWYHKNEFDRHFPRGLSVEAQKEYSLAQVLAYQGPNSIPDAGIIKGLGEHPLLEVMCMCRRKLSADARDKFFGILGVLPEEMRRDFPVNYSLSVKEVYVSVVDSILFTTQRLDVICESIHYPPHTSAANLPTWCPDWSYITETTALGHLVRFAASGNTTAKYKFLDEPRRRQLQIQAIYLGTVGAPGIAVGTLCTTSDYLVAFLHWRALLLNIADEEGDSTSATRAKEDAFCRTLCLNQVPPAYDAGGAWLKATYHVFASLLREKLPRLQLDPELRNYLDEDTGIAAEGRRSFLHQHFKRMMGRCFFVTDHGDLGLGTGFMTAGDIVVVPYGCSTPVLLRPEGRHGEFRFVGDAYVHGFMQGEALELADQRTMGRARERMYTLH